MIARLSMVVSASILLILGVMHLACTFWGTSLAPRDAALQGSMSRVSPGMTEETTMWRCWMGFNASHSLGLILFGLIYGYLALAHGQLLFRSGFLLLVGLTMLACLIVLCRLYFFSAPLIGVSLSFTFYVVSIALSRESGKPDRVYGQLVSPDYFSVLGLEAQGDRLFSAELDKTGDAPTVVISDRYWRSHFNSAPDAIGQTIRLNGQNATIVGVTPSKFSGALTPNPVEIFVPVTVPATVAPELGGDALHNRSFKGFRLLMRLAPGVTIDSAEAALDGITRSFWRQQCRWEACP